MYWVLSVKGSYGVVTSLNSTCGLIRIFETEVSNLYPTITYSALVGIAMFSAFPVVDAPIKSLLIPLLFES